MERPGKNAENGRSGTSPRGGELYAHPTHSAASEIGHAGGRESVGSELISRLPSTGIMWLHDLAGRLAVFHPAINRRITTGEYHDAVNIALDEGLYRFDKE